MTDVSVDDSDDRFVVTSVRGFAVVPGGSGRVTSGKPPTSFYVLDRLDAYRVVGDFTAPINGGYGGDDWRRRQAESLARKLNAWHKAEGWQEVAPLEVAP